MSRAFIRKNKTSVAIAIFLLVFVVIQGAKPAFLYNDNGGFRHFGIGYRNKTVIPIWFLTMILAIFSYVAILYYLALPKYRF
jgi:hypothetical protein